MRLCACVVVKFLFSFLFCFVLFFFYAGAHRSFYRRIRYFASKVYVKQVTHNELRVFSQHNTICQTELLLVILSLPFIRPDFSVLLTDLNERIR